MKKFRVKKGENGQKYLENATKMDIIFGKKNRENGQKFPNILDHFWLGN